MSDGFAGLYKDGGSLWSGGFLKRVEMAKKNRKAKEGKKSYLLMLEQHHWDSLQKVSEDESRSVASVIEDYIDYMLKGRQLKDERERGDRPVLDDIY